MNKNITMYDQFGQHYDRFVNWKERLSVELPFLSSELNKLNNDVRPISVLDAACGTGQHVIALTGRGFNCAGADVSSEMITIARDNAKPSGHEIIFKVAGFGELMEAFGENAFDSLLCLGNSLPHIIDAEIMADTLADFHKVLRPNGMLIIQNRNFDQVLAERERWMSLQTHHDGENIQIFNRFYDFDPDGKITFNIQLISGSQTEGLTDKVFSTRLWPMKKDQVVESLISAGFNDFEFFGDLTGNTFELLKSGNLVVIARAK